MAANGGRVPDFFIVGHAKCGTTALHRMLREHPQIFMCEPKEPWYFARENPHPQTSGERSIEYTGTKFETLEQYLALFAAARPDQRVGEASSSYLWSKSAPARIAQVRPDARIVAIFREPASFLRSLHLQHLSSHDESEKDFRKAIELEAERRQSRSIPKHANWPQVLIYTDRVRYAEQLERYRALFGADQILALIYDDFRADNLATIRRVLRFLEVEEDFEFKQLEANPTVGVRSVRLDHFRRSLRAGETPVLRLARGAGKALTTQRARESLYYPLLRRGVFSQPPPVDERFMLELRRRFRGEVVALGEYLQRDLVSLWGYDALDS
ncbi:MAG TPA: sulfotransferase [Solirubrobacteraceae bacterium]|nr:sulfotransferase [Solirubrobacteraceae bacterium]